MIEPKTSAFGKRLTLEQSREEMLAHPDAAKLLGKSPHWRILRPLIPVLRVAVLLSPILLVAAALLGGPTHAWIYALAPPILVGIPMVGWRLFALFMIWRIDRRAYLDEAKTVRFLMDRGYAEEEIHREFHAAKARYELEHPSPQRTANSEEVGRDHILEVGFKRTQWRVLFFTIAAEEAFFFAPIALFGLSWWVATPMLAFWASLHYPQYTAKGCMFIFAIGMASALWILPHGILVHALGHYLYNLVVLIEAHYHPQIEERMRFKRPSPALSG